VFSGIAAVAPFRWVSTVPRQCDHDHEPLKNNAKIPIYAARVVQLDHVKVPPNQHIP
jgi:hypothetical protein